MKVRILFTAVMVYSLSLYMVTAKTIEGGRMFSSPVKNSRGVVLQSNQLADKKDIVTTFTLQKAYVDNALMQNSASLEIKGFPVTPKEFADITLEKAPSIVDANTIFLACSDEGAKPFKGPQVISFKGKVNSRPGSKVFLSYCDGYMTGYVEPGDGYKYDITTAKESYKSGQYAVSIAEQNYSVLQSPEAEIFKCYTDEFAFGDSPIEENAKLNNESVLAGKTGLLECKISLEGVYSYYDLMGKDSSKAAKYMISVMAHVSNLYEEYLNVRITIPYIIIYTQITADPYERNSKKTFQEKLWYMPSVWPTLPQSSALVCMFCSLNATSDGSSVAGISYGGEPGIGSLCNATSQRSYSIFGINGNYQYPIYNYTWDVSVAAHEIGHNFGAPHTHNCVYYKPPIDTCVTKTKPLPVGDACFDGNPVPTLGTIMSYCHVTNSTHSVDLSFHPRQVAAMRKAAENAFCIKQAANPYISLLSPLSDYTFVAGEVINIRWTSAKINNVAIKYSTDNGQNWVTIIESTPANDTVYSWIAPEVNSGECLISVADASDPTIADVSYLKFTITTPSIECTTPGTGRHYGNREILKIAWTAVVSTRFRIEYSIDNGTTWVIISDSVTGTNVNWDIPSVTSNDCFIRITDIDNSKIIDVSPKFAIGAEVLKIDYPLPGDTLCANNSYNIKWHADFVNYFYMRYSLDNGANWKNYFAPIDATLGTFTWTTPEGFSDKALMRFVLKDDKDVILDETASPFIIDTCFVNGVEDYPVAGFMFRIVSIVPNPVNSSAVVYYECTDENIGSVELYVVNLLGEVAGNVKNISIDCGFNYVNYDFSNLASGSYILCARKNGSVTGIPFVVGR